MDGIKFLTLTKQEMMSIVNNKMGPCLKIEHLQKLLKVCTEGLEEYADHVVHKNNSGPPYSGPNQTHSVAPEEIEI